MSLQLERKRVAPPPSGAVEVAADAQVKETEKEPLEDVDISVAAAAEAVATEEEELFEYDFELKPVHDPPDDGNDDVGKQPLDLLSLEALANDPNAPLFHHLLEMSFDDDRTLRRLMFMTLLRSVNVKEPRIENVRDYIMMAINLQVTFDHYNRQWVRGGVFMSARPRFVIGKLQTSNLIGDIVYWLGLLGRDALWLTLNQLAIDMEETFGIRRAINPLRIISQKVSPASHEATRQVSAAFVVLAVEVDKRYGLKWRDIFVYDARTATSAPGDAAAVETKARNEEQARLKMEYIDLLKYLVNTAIGLRMWVAEKKERLALSGDLAYSETDVTGINLCMNEFAKAVILTKAMKNSQWCGVELYQEQTYNVIMHLRAFTIASALARNPAQMPSSAWYCLYIPKGWFEALKKKVLAPMAPAVLERIKEMKEEPELIKRQFDHAQAKEHKILDLPLPDDMWEPLHLIFKDSASRPLGGLNAARAMRNTPTGGVARSEVVKRLRGRGRGRGTPAGRQPQRLSGPTAAAGAGAGHSS